MKANAFKMCIKNPNCVFANFNVCVDENISTSFLKMNRLFIDNWILAVCCNSKMIRCMEGQCVFNMSIGREHLSERVIIFKKWCSPIGSKKLLKTNYIRLLTFEE